MVNGANCTAIEKEPPGSNGIIPIVSSLSLPIYPQTGHDQAFVVRTTLQPTGTPMFLQTLCPAPSYMTVPTVTATVAAHVPNTAVTGTVIATAVNPTPVTVSMVAMTVPTTTNPVPVVGAVPVPWNGADGFTTLTMVPPMEMKAAIPIDPKAPNDAILNRQPQQHHFRSSWSSSPEETATTFTNNKEMGNVTTVTISNVVEEEKMEKEPNQVNSTSNTD